MAQKGMAASEVQRTGARGGRARALVVVVAALLVVAAGVAGRHETPQRTPAVDEVVAVAVAPTTLNPAASFSAPAATRATDGAAGTGVAMPATGVAAGTGAGMPGYLPHLAESDLRGRAAYLVAVVVVDGADLLETRLTLDASSVYRASVPLPASLPAVIGTLVVYAPPTSDAAARRTIASLAIRLDGRSFPPVALSQLTEIGAGRRATREAGRTNVAGYAILASLGTDGRRVDLSIVVTPMPPTSIGLALRADPCRTAITPYPRNAPDRSTNC